MTRRFKCSWKTCYPSAAYTGTEVVMVGDDEDGDDAKRKAARLLKQRNVGLAFDVTRVEEMSSDED